LTIAQLSNGLVELFSYNITLPFFSVNSLYISTTLRVSVPCNQTEQVLTHEIEKGTRAMMFQI
jgi:hypothetical protein